MKKAPVYFSMAVLLAISACKTKPSDVPQPGNEEELITTMQLMMRDSLTNDTLFFTFRDTDGPGGKEPSVTDSIKIKSAHTYFTEIYLLDESKAGTIDTISNEVREEANDHQFFFHATGNTIHVNYLDEDSHTPPLPLGLSTKWYAPVTGSGSMRIILKHQPGVKQGTENAGESDVDIEFITEVN